MASVLKLDKRLEAVVELCDNCKCIADIGCDHGLVTAELILEDKVERIIATEISPDCLNKAVLLADKINISPYVSFRESDGFKQITKYDNINQAVIAGMGGMKIIEILENRPPRLYNFVLQPMSDVIELRRYLLDNKFKIVVDKMVKENGKYYNIIKVVKGKQKLSELEIYFGFSNFRENYEVLYEYLQEKKKKLEWIKDSLGSLNLKNATMLGHVYEALELFENPDAEQTSEEVVSMEENAAVDNQTENVEQVEQENVVDENSVQNNEQVNQDIENINQNDVETQNVNTINENEQSSVDNQSNNGNE